MNRTRLCPTSRRARWLVAAVVWASVGGRWGPSPARADEPPASGPPSSTDEPLLLQWFAVGALTRGATWFSPPYGPYTSTTSAITGIHEELFGEEGEETIKPFGTVPDLIDLVKRATPAGTWDREGVSIAEQSRSHIVVRATASTLELVEAFLLDLEREAMRTVTFDCVVVRGVPSDVVDANDLQRAIATGVLEPLLGARVVGHVHQSAVARTGGERTYLIDTDVEMDESLAGMDPIVGVLFDGISVRAWVRFVDDARVAATIEAWWAAPAPLTTVRGPGGDVLEPPSVEVREWNHPIDVKPGVWTLLPSSGGISLAVRATVHTPEPAPRGPKGLATVPGRRESGPRTLHRWTISDLDAPVASSQGSDALRLTPPSFTPPPPPEPAEPVRLFPSESLVDVLKLFLGPPSFDPERAGFVRGRTLWASVDSDTAGAIQPLLAALRARFLARTRVRSMVISLPLTSLPEYFSGLDDGVELLADGGAALTRRPGARVLDRQALVLLSGQRDAVVAGREHSYVADYDIIGEKGLIGKPIVRSWLEGSSLDLQADRSLAANAVSCEMRLDLSSLRDNRQVPTPHGAIECPSIGIQRMSGGFTVPVGGSRIVAAHLENGVVTLVILSAESE